MGVSFFIFLFLANQMGINLAVMMIGSLPMAIDGMMVHSRLIWWIESCEQMFCNKEYNFCGCVGSLTQDLVYFTIFWCLIHHPYLTEIISRQLVLSDKIPQKCKKGKKKKKCNLMWGHDVGLSLSR